MLKLIVAALLAAVLCSPAYPKAGAPSSGWGYCATHVDC